MHHHKTKKRLPQKPNKWPTTAANLTLAQPQPKHVKVMCDGRSVPTTWPSVSLCMIVKNEAHNLADCLASVGDFATEVIIVDTGSTDGTVELAQSLGAKVKYFSWIEDFATARNESIKDAVGEWIFWMDGDDRIIPDQLNRLKQALISGQADVYSCQVTSVDEEARTAVDHWRLFRNHQGLKFERPLHETVGLMAVRFGLTLGVTNIVIEHTGYRIDQAGLKLKAARNRRIIEHCLVEEPDNLHWRYHLGVCLAVLEEYEKAAEIYETVIAAPPDSLNWDFEVYQAHVSLINAYIKLKRFDEARRVLYQAQRLFPQRRHLAVLAGIFYLAQDEPGEAVKALERAKTLSGESDRVGHAWPPGRLEAELSRAYLWLGDIAGARAAYQTLLKIVGASNGMISEAMWQTVQTLTEAGNYSAVVDLLKPISRGNQVALRQLAQAEKQRHDWGQALRYLGQAMVLDEPQSKDWSDLAELLLRTGKRVSAERLCCRALTKDENNAEAFNLLGLIAIQQQDLTAAMLNLVRALQIQPEHSAAQYNLAQLAKQLELTSVEAVRQYGLRLLKQQEFRAASEAFTLLIGWQPQDAEAYKSLAVAWRGLGRLDEAVLAWQAAQSCAVGSVKIA